MATYDYTAMKERSGVPEVKDLYHSSGTNFPDPIAANPQMRERFNRDAGKSLETQVKMITSVVSAPTAGSGIMANAALGGVVGALNAQGDSAWDVAKGAAVGAAVGGAVASAAPVFNQVKNWAGYGPKLVVGIGENGARNLGSTASKLPPAQVLPGETSGIHIMQAPLTTRGRVLTGQGTALDRAIIKVKDHSIVKAASEDIKGLTMSPDQRFGDLIGGSEGRMFKQAYPLGSKTPVVQLDPAKADKSIIDFSKAAGHYEHGTVGGGGEQIVVASPGSRVGDTASILAHEGKHMIEPREPLIQASVHSPNRTSVKPTVVDPETGAISKVSMKRPTMEQPNATANFVEEVTGRSPTLEKGAMFSERQVLANPEYYANGGEHGARIFGAMQEKGTADASEILGSVRTRAKYKLTKDPANISGQRNTTAAVPPDQMAAKAGQADLTGMSNFLATDKVPDTIFGIPIVSRREDYTEADIAFFKEHPEAGGYYDMGGGTPEDGTPEGKPTQLDMPAVLGMAVGVNGAWDYRKATGKHLGNYAAFRKAAVPYAKLTDLDFKTELGVNSKVIRDLLRTTKWQYGPGGDPMYETASDPTFRPSFLKAHRMDANTAKEKNKALAALYGNTQTTVGEMLDLESSGLSKMYPDLASMRVRFAPQPTDGEQKYWQGSFNFAGEVPELTIYPRGHNSSEQVRSTILHEIQHYIQRAEGWAPGGSIEKAGSYDNYYRLTGEVGSRITQDRMNLKPEDRIRNPLWKSSDKIARGEDIDLRTAEGQKTVADARAAKAREEAEAKERAKERAKDRERRAKAREDYYRRAKKGAK